MAYTAPEARDLPLGAKHLVPGDLLYLVSSREYWYFLILPGDSHRARQEQKAQESEMKPRTCSIDCNGTEQFQSLWEDY